MNVKTRRAEQSEATRAALLKAARDLFGKRGYADVSTREIVARARVTRGALYHHFRDKRDLFRVVFEKLAEEAAGKVMAAALAELDPWEQQLAGIRASLDASLEPAYQRIALLDAPSVLGASTWRAIEADYSIALVSAGLESLMDEGVIARHPVEPLSHVIFGALTEAGLVLANADDVESARKEMGASIELLLEGLRVQQPE